MVNSSLRRNFAASLIGALITILLLGAILRQGVPASPDGWAYWQGSVSLMHGDGYTYFYDHLTIKDFPPGYSIFLMVVERVIGISGRTLYVSNLILGAMATFSWCWCAFGLFGSESIVRRAGVDYAWKITAATVISAVVVENFQDLRSENLAYTLLPWLLASICRAANATSTKAFAFAVFHAGISSMLLMLVRNADLAFVAASAVLLWSSRVHAQTKLLTIAAFITVSVVPWIAVERALGQGGSHPVHFGSGKYSSMEYFRQAIPGLGSCVISAHERIGLVVLAAWFVLVVFLVWWHRGTDTESNLKSIVVAYGMFCGLSLLFLFVLFNLTPIADPLNGRFVAFVPLMVIALGATLPTRIPTKAFLYSTICLLIAPTFIDLSVAVKNGAQKRYHALSWIYPDDSIRYDVVGVVPFNSGRETVLSPPIYPWILKQAAQKQKSRRPKA